MRYVQTRQEGLGMMFIFMIPQSVFPHRIASRPVNRFYILQVPREEPHPYFESIDSLVAPQSVPFVQSMVANCKNLNESPKTILSELSRLEEQLQSIAGRNRLTVTKKREELIIDRVEKILRMERTCVIREVLRKGDISKLKLIRLLVQRERINHAWKGVKILSSLK